MMSKDYRFHVENGRVYVLDPATGKIRLPQTREEVIQAGEMVVRLVNNEVAKKRYWDGR